MKTPDGAVACVKPNRCDCHPETCCCADYVLYFNKERLASGTSTRMNQLAELINSHAASLDALRGELEAERLASANLTTNLYAAIAARDSAESKLAAVGALADRWEVAALELDSVAETKTGKQAAAAMDAAASELRRALIADAGTGEGGNG